VKKIYSRFFLIAIIAAFIVNFAACQSYTATINVYNWGDYIDPSVIKDFQKEYNIKVNYKTFATNEDMYTKIKNGGGKYDVLFPSEYMIDRMIKEDMLEKLDMDNIENYKYIDSKYKNLSYDPNNEYSVPYMWGTFGIIYNKKMVKKPVDSWSILWDKDYSKQIFMLDSQRESIGVALKLLNYSLNSRDKNHLENAKNKLIEQKPLVLSYVGDTVKDKMVAGEAALAVVWSGDAVTMKRNNPDLEYVIPKEGSNIWFDAMVIPKGAQHKAEAELFINYMCRPDVAYKNAMFIGYSTPHTEAYNMLAPDVKNDPVAYPSKEVLDRCEVFEDVSDVLRLYDEIWSEVMAK